MKNQSNQHTIRDCITNLQFVPTSNGREEYRQDSSAETGDCAEVALSIATGTCYGTTCRRLTAIVEALKHVTEKNTGGDPEAPDIDPTIGTPKVVVKLFLQMHGYQRVRGEEICICACEASYVVLGKTDTVDHVATISGGEVFGGYDVTTEKFDAYEVWKGTQQISQKLELINAKNFASRKKLVARLNTML